MSGQRASALAEEARQAYLLLEFDRATALARDALEREAPDTLTAAGRADVLMLLGTIAVLRERPREAAGLFRSIILDVPRYTPDSLIIPSRPLQAFQQARENVKATTITVPPSQQAGPGRPVRATVLVSSLHDVVVAVLNPMGDTVDVLWAGPVRDAVAVTWLPDPDASGRHVLVSLTRVDGRPAREVRVPLIVRPVPLDTVPWPVAPTALPIRTGPAGGGGKALAIGLGLGAAVVVAPVVAGSDIGTPSRLVVAGGLSVGGLLGFLRGRRSGVDAEAVAANVRAQAAWERERDRVRAENQRRQAQYALDVTAGPATRHELTDR